MPSSRPHRARAAALLAGICLATGAAHGQDASWIGSGGAPADWNTAANWSSAIVPTGTATFTSSGTTTTQIRTSASAVVNALQFDAGAPFYQFDFTEPLTVVGAGFTGNSGVATMRGGSLSFLNSSSAGSATIGTGTVEFHNTSTAANAHFAPTPGVFPAAVVSVSFFDASTAANATFGCVFSPPTACHGATVTFFNTSSAGSATIDRANLTFRDTSTAGNAIITSTFQNEALQFRDASTAGNATITNGPASTTIFSNSSTAGSATLTTMGTLGFNNSSTAGNATIIQNGGVTRFNDSSSAGSATITNNFFAVFFFDTSTAGSATITTNNGAQIAFFNNSTGGQARLITNAGGIVDFGTSTGPAGDGQITAGSIEGAGTYFLGSRTLTVGGNNLSTTVSGVISGTGALTKVGDGVLTLSGTSAYTGATTVNAGALIVDGSIESSSGVTVNAGGTLGGVGTLPSVTLNGGTLSPGNSIGTLTVNGNLTFSTAAAYLVEVSPTAADRTNVSGAAQLAGTVQAVFQPGDYIARSYTIVSAAGGRSGTFDALVTTNLPAPFSASLGYGATDVVLNLTLGLGQLSGLNQNQANVAGAIDRGFIAGGGIGGAFLSLFGLPSSALPGALSQLSGEVGTGAVSAGFQSTSRFLELMLDPFLETSFIDGSVQGRAIGFAPEGSIETPDLPAAVLGYAPMPTKAPVADHFERRWKAWGAAYGSFGSMRGDAATGSNDLTLRSGGFAAGLDYRVTPDTVIGVAIAGNALNYVLDNGLGSGSGNAVQAGVYGATHWGRSYVAAALAVARHELSTDRTVVIPGITDRLAADFDATGFGARIEGGYRYAMMSGIGISPYGALTVQSFRTPTYDERDASGLEAFALSYRANTTTDTRSELGARIDHRTALENGSTLVLRGRLAWMHDYSSTRSIVAGFQTLPGAIFTVAGALPAEDAALVSAASELRLASGMSFRAKFDGEFSGHTRSYGGTAGVRMAW